ncbi:hypothetical protein ACHAWC_006806 [Mediolabrus comicus]
MMPLIPPPPVSPAAARRARPSPRSVATQLSQTQSKSSGFDASEEDENSFLAGFARSLKFHDDDDDEFDPSTSSNPFRKSKASTRANSKPATSSDATAASTNLFSSDFESTNPFTEATAPLDKFTSNYFEIDEEELAMSDYYTSEATTAVRTNSSVLSGRLLSNLNAQSVTVSEDNMMSPKVANNQSKSDYDRKNLNTATVYTAQDELHRANSRGRNTNREEDSQHRSKSRSRSRARDVFRGMVQGLRRSRSSSSTREEDQEENLRVQSAAASEDKMISKVTTDTQENVGTQDAAVTPENSPSARRKSMNALVSQDTHRERKDIEDTSRRLLSSREEDRAEDLRHRHRDEVSDRNSRSHARQMYRHRQLRSESFEDASLPTIDDGSFGTNSFALRDNDNNTYLTDGDSFTLDDESYIPRGYSRRRGGGARFLCGCDDNDVARGMNELRAAFKDINKVVEASFWCVMPTRSARRHSSYRERERNYDDRPSRSRSRSRSITRRSRSTSARRNGERPTSKVRGQSVEPPAEPKKRMEPTLIQPSPSAEILL